MCEETGIPGMLWQADSHHEQCILADIQHTGRQSIRPGTCSQRLACVQHSEHCGRMAMASRAGEGSLSGVGHGWLKFEVLLQKLDN